ncbi:uncharacterized protein [Onthophagus taurus]|uniref:uncharacterized protein n=1 Tax=Onthophagus taurus TaxID=166361 RepID=UPI0039BE0AED
MNAKFKIQIVLHTVIKCVPANIALENLKIWSINCKLKFNASKSEAIFFGKPNQRYPNILLDDTKLNFKYHLDFVTKKGREISNKIGATANISWGLNGKAASVIYKGAVEPCMFYAASIWENKIKDVKSRNKLISVQRVLGLKAARAFSTVSNDAFGVLSGLLPADVRFKEIALWQNLYNLNDQDLRLFTGVDINHDKIEKEAKFLTDIHPAKRDIMDFKSRKIVLNKGIQLFTDGVKCKDCVGAAFVVFCDGVEVYFEKIKLGALCDNYHAELLAVNSAIKYIIKEKIVKCELYSDSISVLEGLKNMTKPSILQKDT